jgi:molybdenum cofactor cytidylyltransferase
VIPLVLAAGRGERMGMPKALLDLEGMTALERVLRTAAGAGLGPPMVVLGFAAKQVLSVLTLPAAAFGTRFAVNPEPERGQTSSVQTGLVALAPLPPEVAAIALWPVDHALVEAEDVTALVGAARAHPESTVVLPSHGGRAGHPALLRRALFPAILALAPDAPLRDLVREERPRTTYVERPSDRVLVDLDTPADAEAARRRLRAGDRSR